jgi:hypothetical protein
MAAAAKTAKTRINMADRRWRVLAFAGAVMGGDNLATNRREKAATAWLKRDENER